MQAARLETLRTHDRVLCTMADTTHALMPELPDIGCSQKPVPHQKVKHLLTPANFGNSWGVLGAVLCVLEVITKLVNSRCVEMFDRGNKKRRVRTHCYPYQRSLPE